MPKIQVWSRIRSSICILTEMAILDASYYDYSEVTENDNFQIQLPNTKKANHTFGGYCLRYTYKYILM